MLVNTLLLAKRTYRCGHCMVPLTSGSTVVLGGFDSLGITYHDSAELLGSSVTLPGMSTPRTGFAACAGPDGAVYAAGELHTARMRLIGNLNRRFEQR